MDEISELRELAKLIRIRNDAEQELAELIRRPGHSGHLGEFIAARIFDIELHTTATHKASDGIFRSGPFAGRSVNVKLYFNRTGIIDLVKSEDASNHADTYLVLTGPKSVEGSSSGKTAPILITNVFLFESYDLLTNLAAANRRPAEATSFKANIWDSAMIYPQSNHPKYVISEEQRALLDLFD